MVQPFLPENLDTAARLAVSGLVGLAVGIERQRSGHAVGSDQDFAGIRTFLLRDHHLVFGDERTGHRGAQQVLTLVDRAGLQKRKEIIAGKFVAQVFDDQLAGAAGFSFRIQPRQFFLLADVRAETNDFAVVVLTQPRHDHGRIQSSGIRQDHFLDLRLRHAAPFKNKKPAGFRRAFVLQAR